MVAATALVAIAGGAAVTAVGRREEPPPVPTACAGPVANASRSSEALDALARLDAAFLPVARSELDLLSNQLQQFLTGTIAAPDMARLAAEGGANFAYARRQVAALTFPAWAGDLGGLFPSVAALYVEAADSLRLATLVEGDARVQLVRKSQRERRIADALYDRGRALLSAPVPVTTVPRVEIHPPVALPDLTGIEEGPPFETQPPPTRVTGETAPGEFRLDRAVCRPIERWRPDAREALKAVTDALAADQAPVTALASANAEMGRADLPAGAAHEALVVRGALYVYEEMARSRRASAAVTGELATGLHAKARRLRVIGDGLLGFATPRLGIPGPPPGPDPPTFLDEASPFDPNQAPVVRGPLPPPAVTPRTVSPSPVPSMTTGPTPTPAPS